MTKSQFLSMFDDPMPETTLGQELWGLKANEDIEALVKEWANCREVSFDRTGATPGIWIANPQAGHWLSDEQKAEFVAWFEKRQWRHI